VVVEARSADIEDWVTREAEQDMLGLVTVALADIEEWVPWEAEQDMLGLVTVALADINLTLKFARTVAGIVPVTGKLLGCRESGEVPRECS
jgi:hypothetical protein